VIVQEPQHSIDDGFLDLVYADEQWLDAEFDAIVAANWHNVPGQLQRAADDGAAGQVHRPAVLLFTVAQATRDPGARQRSPPAARENRHKRTRHKRNDSN